MSGWRSDIAETRQILTGEPSGGWRNDLSETAQIMGSDTALDWRRAIRFICEYHEQNPPDPRRLFDITGNALFDSAGYALFVRY